MSEISWKAFEYKKKRKTINWFWSLWIISFFIIFLSIYFNDDYIFSILIFMVTILIHIANLKNPEIKKYLINNEGLSLENNLKFIKFSDVKNYNIDKNSLYILLSLNKLSTIIKIPYEENQNIQKLDIFLETKMEKNKELDIPFFEKILSNLLGL